MGWVQQREHELVAYAMAQMSRVEGLRILGPAADQRGGAVAFTLGEIHPHDIAAILDSEGIAIRAGHHCAQPIHDFYGIPASARASFYFYNTFQEIDRLIMALDKVHAVLGM
jgi:cysteine desulfurase/selenocysteine lyase